MIKEILAYQTCEKEKLRLLEGLENGKIKREIDVATRELDSAKMAVLTLDNDAKSLASSIEAIRRNLSELLGRADQMVATNFEKQGEDEIGSAIAYMSGMSSKIAGYEKQLDETTKKIEAKHKHFEDAKQKIMRNQKLIAAYTPEYEKQKAALAPKLEAHDKELAQLGKSVNPKLLERYKRVRAMAKNAKPIDIVIPLVGNQCGGCMFEMPLSRIHAISTENYVACEECGKLIYK